MKKQKIIRKNNKKINKKKLATVLIIFILILFIIIKVIVGINSDKLKGEWTIDEYTTYCFYGKGKGSLKLPSNEYKFNYDIKKNTVSIDFEKSENKDLVFEFSFKNKKLILKATDNTKATYTLTKIKIK